MLMLFFILFFEIAYVSKQVKEIYDKIDLLTRRLDALEKERAE